jgi:hypothetical protein
VVMVSIFASYLEKIFYQLDCVKHTSGGKQLVTNLLCFAQIFALILKPIIPFYRALFYSGPVILLAAITIHVIEIQNETQPISVVYVLAFLILSLNFIIDATAFLFVDIWISVLWPFALVFYTENVSTMAPVAHFKIIDSARLIEELPQAIMTSHPIRKVRTRLPQSVRDPLLIHGNESDNEDPLSDRNGTNSEVKFRVMFANRPWMVYYVFGTSIIPTVW